MLRPMPGIVLTAVLAITALPAAAQQRPGVPDPVPGGGTLPAPGPISGPPAAGPTVRPQGPSTTAKGSPVNGVLVIYGNERCPTDKNGNEIVVCERRSTQEQFRVPKELREFKVTPENQSWAKQAEGTLDAGASGIGSCSAIGPGGSIGCSQRQFRAAKTENQERKAAEEAGK